MNKIKIKAEVVRSAKVFTIDKRNDQETLVMLVAKVIEPSSWASDKNITFYLGEQIHHTNYYNDKCSTLYPRFTAMATSETGDEIILETSTKISTFSGEKYLTGRVFSFYNKTLKLGDWEIDRD